MKEKECYIEAYDELSMTWEEKKGPKKTLSQLDGDWAENEDGYQSLEDFVIIRE